MRIVEFSLENYKSYRKVGPLRLERGFNVVVGPNNAGKTALLEGLTLQMAAHPHRSLSTQPRASTPLDQVSRASFTIAATGQESTRRVADADAVLYPRTFDPRSDLGAGSAISWRNSRRAVDGV